ncbi:NAD(P)/FAD-dependent oxidoreductase [Halomonas getboli]|uniref:NAD(P)/FAD-dependent oxidoreductase n=1 Tax=Halomonas getboli TaxID=2935862 RepID=UPI001FFE4603|nr:FAD-dependent oxidoreductase [Halomonas getboli]MCK2183108.1 FAD-dependent oxidoreductase [Halomonas getboli]
MSPSSSTEAPLLLVGAGHANLHLIDQRHRLPMPRVVLLDPGGFWYSGMAGGVLGGQYAPAADRLDPMALAHRRGVEALRGRLTGLDLERHEAQLDDGRRLAVSAVSLNLGSTVIPPPAHPEGPSVWAVKPIPRLVALRRRLERDFAAGKRPRLLVAGGGASGVEVACQLRALADRHGLDPTIRLLTRAPELLPGAPRGAVRWLHRRLVRRRIEVATGLALVGHLPGGVMATPPGQPPGEDNARFFAADHVIHAVGLTPPPVIERLGLPTIAGRGLTVTDCLQSPAASWVFAAGDCAALLEHELPRLGVYGVRQAPVLRNNLAAWWQGEALRPYRPQRRALSILDLGHGQALAIRGGAWWGGRLAWHWKRHLDTRFLAGYRG